jgi:uncharacterized protein YndB with AHSA1/START domain
VGERTHRPASRTGATDAREQQPRPRLPDLHPCDAEQLWEGITSAEFTRRYFHETAIESTWEPGAPVLYLNGDGSTAVDGEVIECDAPRRLSFTWHVQYDPEAITETPSRVTWEIEPMGETCRLTLTHDDFPDSSVISEGVREGWMPILSSLMSLIETGEPLLMEAWTLRVSRARSPSAQRPAHRGSRGRCRCPRR